MGRTGVPTELETWTPTFPPMKTGKERNPWPMAVATTKAISSFIIRGCTPLPEPSLQGGATSNRRPHWDIPIKTATAVPYVAQG